MCAYKAFVNGALSILLPALLASGTAFAQSAKPGKPAETGKPADSAKPAAAKPEDQAAGQIAKAWGLFYSGQKYSESVKVLEPLTTHGQDSIRTEAVYLLGRCKWSSGQGDEESGKNEKDIAEAKKLWTSLSARTLNVHLRRVQIIQAIQLAADGKESDAAAILEKLLAEGHPAASTPEAAIELAKVYAALGRMADAQKALDFAAAFAKKLPAGGEIAQESVKPFIDHAEYLKKHLDPAAEAWAKADRLRIQKKFPDAIKSFTQIVERHASTDFAPRSEYSIGLCHLQAGRQADAVAAWDKFIAAASAGPWRGQAFLQLLDLNIADLNIDEAARFATLAQNALPAALADDKAKTSWQPVAISVGLRVGVIAYARKDTAAAADAFEKVKATTEKNTPKELIESIDRLIGYCKAGTDVIPSECRTGSADQKVSTALGLGVIFNLCRQFEPAEKIFTRIIGEPAKPAAGGTTGGASGMPRTPSGVSGASAGIAKLGNPSTEQLAFARFGRAVALYGRNSNEAKADLQESLKLIPAGKGSWQDEPLYCLATILQNEAQAKYDRETKKEAETSNKSGQPAKPLTPQEQEALAKAEKERLAALVKAKEPALELLRELVKNYPKSPRAEYASYMIGLIQYQSAEVAPDDKSEQLFKGASLALNRFCESWPKSQWAGFAYVMQTDVAIERVFDLKYARALATSGAEWADNQNIANTEDSTQANPAIIMPPWASSFASISNKERDRTIYECYLRGAVMEYLAANYTQAEAFLKKAGPSSPPEGGVVFNDNANLEKIGLHFFLQAISSKKELVAPEALKAIGDDKNLEMTVRLADLYLWIIRPDKAESIFLRVAEARRPFEKASRDIRSYCIAQMGLALDRIDSREAEGQAWFMRLQEAPYKGTYFAGLGLYRQAVTTFNNTQDPKKAIPLYQQMIRDYPQHPMTERAYTYLCLNYLRTKEFDKAEQTLAELAKAFPKTDRIDYLKENISKAKADKAERKGS